MKTVERDLALARELDRVVTKLGAGTDSRLRQIRKRGSRRRAITRISAATCVVIFSGTVGLGALTIRGHGPEPSPPGSARWVAVGGTDAGWRLRVPRAWHVRLIDDSSCAATAVRTGAFVSNVRFDLHHPDGTTSGKCNGSRWVFAGFPRKGVAIQIEPIALTFGLVEPQPDTPFPIGTADLRESGGIRGGPAQSYLVVWRDGEEVMNLQIYIGHGASLRDRSRAERILESLRLAIRGQRVSSPSPTEVPPSAAFILTSPHMASPETRVRFHGAGFSGFWPPYWVAEDRVGGLGVGLVREFGDGCEATVATRHARVRRSASGKVAGSFTVPAMASCFQEDRTHAVTPGTWQIVLGCHVCDVGTIRIRSGEATRQGSP
jgi:hypothetical protein